MYHFGIVEISERVCLLRLNGFRGHFLTQACTRGSAKYETDDSPYKDGQALHQLLTDSQQTNEPTDTLGACQPEQSGFQQSAHTLAGINTVRYQP